jgi:Fic family protein
MDIKSNNLKIISIALLEEFKKQLSDNLIVDFEFLMDSELSTESFSFYTSVASVFSSKIEGEEIELDSYVKHKKFGIKYLPDYTQKIDDLYNAYIFAQKNKLSKKKILKQHHLLAKHFLDKTKRGVVRNSNMYVISSEGKIEYVAATPAIVKQEMELFFHDVDVLLKRNLNYVESFYFAAYLHLLFVKIHPFEDGNGRTARLIEKWFLAEKLGEKAWLIQSEKNYYNYHHTYYKNLQKLGIEYEVLDFSKALPFLLMLPNALQLHKKNKDE